MKKHTYPQYCYVYDENGKEILNVITQLYKVGIYIAVYSAGNSIPDQFSTNSIGAKKFMKQFSRNNLKKGYSSKFGPEITVAEIDGFWEKVA